MFVFLLHHIHWLKGICSLDDLCLHLARDDIGNSWQHCYTLSVFLIKYVPGPVLYLCMTNCCLFCSEQYLIEVVICWCNITKNNNHSDKKMNNGVPPVSLTFTKTNSSINTNFQMVGDITFLVIVLCCGLMIMLLNHADIICNGQILVKYT